MIPRGRFAPALLFVSIVLLAGGATWLVGSRLLARRAAGAAEPAPGTTKNAPQEQAAPAEPELRSVTVTIWQRATTDDVRLAAVPAQVVWFDAPADRARQIAQLVLDGVPDAKDAVPPGPPGLKLRDVLIANTGTAWVDLDGASLAALAGSDEEYALVGALARSLTGALEDVRRVGILVDGGPRETLAGHVDLGRTYSGQEWPTTGGDDAAAPAPQGEGRPGSAPASTPAPGATPVPAPGAVPAAPSEATGEGTKL